VRREWRRFYTPLEKPEKFGKIVQGWDTANKATELSDYSACTTWGWHNGCLYLLDVFRRRMEFPELKEPSPKWLLAGTLISCLSKTGRPARH